MPNRVDIYKKNNLFAQFRALESKDLLFPIDFNE